MATIQCKDIKFFNIQAILFDKNGTLEDSESYLRSLGQRGARMIDAQVPGIGEPLLMAFGINSDRLDPAGLISVASRRETEVAAAAYIAETGRGWFESLKIARQALAEADQYIDKTPSPLFAGSLEVLKYLSEAGLKLGILSAATTEDVQRFVSTHQLGDYLQLEMGVDEGPSKPDPILFLQACQALGVEPGATLMVGDSVGDMQMARNAQAAGCIGITWIGNSGNVKGADVVINQLDEIQVVM
ncbi:HAD family hydrolase [Anabaena cylindrica FACHB-243]|uniref:HAD-superfamily hydrolase, subfamily IA, variant 1 n=1 Tax=Anabaena cylindrica (strain ATCC 27899 / PCC 7122) TaxID=272123 RepID=K9ZNJ4_ANACC|nr:MULTISPECIES: HAD family hydrolase [Anabaena]AFZ60364.1 HAD-superfamily hydrolase, subfamily IA, variant 1 [Anabaena cylindrica PCC 7122]MBD2418912.1 HAD family hydrolase [Anabaena cylindrica FACHB-243]MBY5284866.1 HAD family hydrolase [Anabaena sp. CCAP 1446/1C]MBY5309473.1 HAD family hydrolase [Anabaena sp. CCAP 1446/1C]MCM2404501.1 HAD family hydrolase [Anabaena sp. CCAP 1446/1C]